MGYKQSIPHKAGTGVVPPLGVSDTAHYRPEYILCRKQIFDTVVVDTHFRL